MKVQTRSLTSFFACSQKEPPAYVPAPPAPEPPVPAGAYASSSAKTEAGPGYSAADVDTAAGGGGKATGEAAAMTEDTYADAAATSDTSP